MKLFIFYLYFTLFILFPYTSFAQSPEDRIQFILDSTYQAHPEAVGFMIHVESPINNISVSKTTGVVAKDSDKQLLPNQPILIASNTKTYVSATILKLVENRKLKLDQPIKKLVKRKTRKSLKSAGYDINKITVRNLLSHSSGITDYVDKDYFAFVNENPLYEWTREEQIQLAIKLAKPVESGKSFAYGDINYLLLAEIIERKTNKPFNIAIRELLEFDEHNIEETWFVNLETKPTKALPFAAQYSNKLTRSSLDINPSWDLYGAGGQASTTKDLAMFFQLLFEGEIIKDKALLAEMTTYVLPKEDARNYCLGVFNIPSFLGNNVYYHGGFWGTDVIYLPELNSTISIFTLVRESRDLNIQINKEVIKVLKTIEK